MLERFGHIIPWILVAVLGLLALSILIMHRTLLSPYYIHEGFQDTTDDTSADTTADPPADAPSDPTSEPPPPADSMKRKTAINNMKSAAAAKPSNVPNDDKITEINTFILTAMTNMLTMYKSLPDQMNDILGKTIDITDDTCYIVKMIEAKYTKKPLDATIDPAHPPVISHLTKSRERKLSMQESQFLSKHKVKGVTQSLIECFDGGTDDSGADISGAKDISGATDVSGETDISGYTFGQMPQTAGTVPIKDISGAMLKKHAGEDKKIVSIKVKLLYYQGQVLAITNSKDYREAIDKLRKVPLTAQFGSEFIEKNKQAIKEGYKDHKDPKKHKDHKKDKPKPKPTGPYQNSDYTYPVPYNNLQLNTTQKEHLQTIEEAYKLLMQLSKDLGVNFNLAQQGHTQLLNEYKTIDPSYTSYTS
jgi:hypothetical protein